jgi:hypothetical protein
MAELEPGHPDELVQAMTNWLRQSQSAEGELLPAGIEPIEWAVRRFIDSWKGSARVAVESVERSIHRAIGLCDSGASLAEISKELEIARQELGVSLRDELGLYEWNKEGKT